MPNNTARDDTMQNSTIQYNAMPYNTVHIIHPARSVTFLHSVWRMICASIMAAERSPLAYGEIRTCRITTTTTDNNINGWRQHPHPPQPPSPPPPPKTLPSHNHQQGLSSAISCWFYAPADASSDSVPDKPADTPPQEQNTKHLNHSPRSSLHAQCWCSFRNGWAEGCRRFRSTACNHSAGGGRGGGT